ncbi:MAG: hypothetical protein B7733_08480 [Myxococcales bacterium FL481]|nr:MAG: hypothetical protein B7733_08480 [Myxococcales bacterium FL481]
MTIRELHETIMNRGTRARRRSNTALQHINTSWGNAVERHRGHLHQAEVAELMRIRTKMEGHEVRVHPTSIARWEQGEVPNLRNFRAICLALPALAPDVHLGPPIEGRNAKWREGRTA